MKMRKINLFLIVIFVFSLFGTAAFAATANDSILSQHIKEADGTSGQNTNTGSGIKTGHIQDGAVTDAKITGPISGSKLGNHTHSGSDIVDGTITNSKIATEAITPDKIGFYRNVIIVASSGGDFTNPVDAMNAITDASASNPYLVKIMPGVYNIGSQSVQMKAYVTLEGSGQTATKIIQTTGSGSVVIAASNSEIRLMTVETTVANNGPSPYVIDLPWVVASVISDVTVLVSHGGGGIMSLGASALLRNIKIDASGDPYTWCMLNASSNVTIIGLSCTSVGGYAGNAIANYVGNLVIRDSVLDAATYLFTNTGSVYVVNSQLAHGTILEYGSSPIKCLGAYDANYNPITCQ